MSQVTEVVLDRARDIEKDLAQGRGKEVDPGNDQDLENGQGHDGLDLGKGLGLGKGHDQERDLSHGQGKRDQDHVNDPDPGNGLARNPEAVVVDPDLDPVIRKK